MSDQAEAKDDARGDRAAAHHQRAVGVARRPCRFALGWRRRGEGPQGYPIGRHVRYRRAAIESWLATVLNEEIGVVFLLAPEDPAERVRRQQHLRRFELVHVCDDRPC